MRLIVLFTLFAMIFFFGCGEDIEEEMEIEEEMMEEVISDTLTPLEKAQEAMTRVNERRMEEHQKAAEVGDFSILFKAADTIYQEELGFGEAVWQELLNTWEAAHGERVQAGETDQAGAQRYIDFLSFYFQKFDFENMTGGEFFFEYMSAYDEIVIEYLRLSYDNQDSTPQQLYALLKQSIIEGNATISYPEGF